MSPIDDSAAPENFYALFVTSVCVLSLSLLYFNAQSGHNNNMKAVASRQTTSVSCDRTSCAVN